MKRVLITGANGFLGQKLLEALASEPGFSVIASTRGSRPSSRTSFSHEKMDITQAPEVAQCFEKHRPDIVFHTAAMSLADACENDPEACWKTNVIGTELLAESAEKYRSHFIHFSTDFVFDGLAGPYHEEAAPRPVSMYGKSKRASEQVVMKGQMPWAVVRTILVYGLLPLMPRPNIVTFVKNSLEQKKPIRTVSDQFRTPTLAEDLIQGCLAVAKRGAEGIFHLSGPEMTSIHDFSLKIAATFGLDASLISPVLTADLHEKALRPPRTGFILDKAREVLGYAPVSIEEGLRRVKKQSDLFSLAAD